MWPRATRVDESRDGPFARRPLPPSPPSPPPTTTHDHADRRAVPPARGGVRLKEREGGEKPSGRERLLGACRERSLRAQAGVLYPRQCPFRAAATCHTETRWVRERERRRAGLSSRAKARARANASRPWDNRRAVPRRLALPKGRGAPRTRDTRVTRRWEGGAATYHREGGVGGAVSKRKNGARSASNRLGRARRATKKKKSTPLPAAIESSAPLV